MSFDSTSPGQTARRSTTDTPPEAPHPGSDLWHALRDERIEWEGQVLVVGSGVDIPALLVLTGDRLALIQEGTLALEAPRTWLRPEPRLLSGNGVRISVTPQGADQTDRLTVRVRDGRGAAARLVGTVSRRLVSPREERRLSEPEPADQWTTAIGASTAIALPPLPDFGDELEAAPDARRGDRAWPPIEQHAIPAPVAPDTSTPGWGAASVHEATPPAPPVASSWPSRPSASSTRNGSPKGDPPAVEEERHQFNRGLVWGLRSAIMAVVVFTALYFGRDSLPANFDVSLPANIEQRFGLADDPDTTDVSQLPGDAQDTAASPGTETPGATNADSDGTSGPPNSDQIGTSEEDGDGLGGQNGEITPVDPGIGGYAEPTTEPEVDQSSDDVEARTEPEIEPTVPPVEPTAPPVEPTDPPVEPTAPPAQPTDSPVEPTVPQAQPTDPPAVPTIEPTEPPVTEAPATDVPATEIPTTAPATEVPPTEAPATERPANEAPATDEPVTETPGTEIPPTEAPTTEAPATALPTEIPGRQDPTETATPAEEPTEVPVTAESTASLESQPPSVDPGSTPEQALASDGFRYATTGAARGETIAALPDLNAVGIYGEWVVLSMYGENWSDTEQVFDMSEFKLYADGEEVLVDVGNAWVSGLLGYTPAYGNTDAILWAPGEGHPFALTFLVPPDAEQLSLMAGDQAIDLSAALAEPQPLAQDADAAPLPGYIEAQVVEVLSAEEIVIEIDGIEQTVRYLGLDVPTDDDCYANEATSTNRRLVEGKTVRLERQATDVDARGNWVRDVWAPAEDGRYFLVSEALVAQGAATAGISEPNTRYEGWLVGSQSMAKAEGRGLWGACDDAAADSRVPPAAVAPGWNRATYHRTATAR